MNQINNFGAYIGRFAPMHLAHGQLIEEMISTYGDNCLVLIGSCNRPMSFRNIFTYEDRRNIIKTIFPTVKVVGLPDFEDDKNWFCQLDDTLSFAGVNPKDVTFFGGCKEDVVFFQNARNIKIINRFDGSTPKISATEVRDALIEKRPLEHLLYKSTIPMIQEIFAMRWSSFKGK